MGKDSAFFSSLIEKGQFRVDETGHARLFGEYLFMMPPEVLLRLQDRLEEQIGEAEMEEILTDLGAFQTRQALERYQEQYNWDQMSKERILDYGFNILRALGWGRIEPETIDTGADPSFRVEVLHPTLPAVYRDENDELSERPICHYLSGMIRQSMESIIFGEDVEITETSCAATGGDRCVFEGRPTG